MKILYICNEYPPYLHGGIGTFTRDIAEGMVKNGHQVIVWGIYSGLRKKNVEDINGVNVIRLPYRKINSRFNNLFFLFRLNLELRSFLRLNHVDIIECQEWQGLLPFGINQKYIIRMHGAAVFFDKLLERSGNRLTHILERFTLKSASNLVAVSDFCGRETLRILNLKKNYEVIYNSVDTKRIAAFETNSYQEYSIVFANSVLPKKGVFELSMAFNIIASVFPQSRLIIIGKLGYNFQGKNIKELIMEFIDPKYRDRVYIPGWLDRADDVYKFLAEAHVCCYPSHMEGFGIAPVEPMVLGKPVIYMKGGPGPEVIEDKVSGFLVDTKEPQDIANVIIDVFQGKYPIDEISKNAKSRSLLLFDRDTVFMKRNIEYYKSIISR